MSSGARATDVVPPMRLLNVRNGKVIADNVRFARTPWERAKGLLFALPLGDSEALWIEPCNGIHTFGMRYTIGVIAVSRDIHVVAVHDHIKPNRVLLPVRGGHATVELRPEALRGADVQIGDRLRLVPDVGESASE